MNPSNIRQVANSVFGSILLIRTHYQHHFQLLSCAYPTLYDGQKRWAGHSKWQNIKFKKMHKDNARAKIFGQLSREIIQAVKGT